MIEVETLFIFLVFSAGIGYSCFKEGTKKGAETCLELLHEKKIICYDNRGHIKPNPFFDHGPWVDPEENS